jgi:hypothetical protein
MRSGIAWLAASMALLFLVCQSQTSRPQLPATRPDSQAVLPRSDPEAARRDPVISAGLDWLKRHQSPDGRWACGKFSANCDSKKGAACAGPGADAYDAGVTGLALLALLGAGYDSVRESPYTASVREGLKYLTSIQNAAGAYGPTEEPRLNYCQACATWAMSEAHAMTKEAPLAKSAEAAVKFINACQNPYKAWRYGKEPGDNDVSVTGWILLALASAQRACVPVNVRTAKDGLAFIDSVTDEDTGRTGYYRKGESSVRPEGMQAKFPATESETLTAEAICARLAWGETSPLDPIGARLLSKRLPSWDETRGSVDMDYWFWGMFATAQLKGDLGGRWQRDLTTDAAKHQVKAGCARGSWDPKDPWGGEGGRVYSTALMVMALEAATKVPKTSKPPKPR